MLRRVPELRGVYAMRARECRWYSALSIVAPSVNVLRRTRRKPSTIRSAAPDVVIGQSTAARAGAHPYRRRRSGSVLSKWVVGAIRRGTFRRVFASCGTVGTRSRAIRGSTSDDRVGCSASDARCAPARPALDVSTRLLRFLRCALASADGIRPFPLMRLL